jgi:hypothetical protein
LSSSIEWYQCAQCEHIWFFGSTAHDRSGAATLRHSK